MTPLTLVPDVEKVVSDHLRTHADIVALNTRVVGKSPESRTTSWVRVTELDSPGVNYPDHLASFLIQCDCYAGATGGQPEVKTLARTVRAVMTTLSGAYTGGVVTGVQPLGGPRGLDTDLEPARDSKVEAFLVWAHP